MKFELSVNGQSVSRVETTKWGVASAKLDSSKKEGAAQFVVSSGSASTRRVVQEVASDPCNIRMHAERDKNGILVQTDPIHDCAGNSVPDGTIVTFTLIDSTGKSAVDARIKRGIAQAQLPRFAERNHLGCVGSRGGQRDPLGRWRVKAISATVPDTGGHDEPCSFPAETTSFWRPALPK